MSWECVIGLEAHVQLSTETKLFSRASTSFGQEPNTNVNLVDCGLPGVLPTVNKNAFYKAIRFGLAVDADINQTSLFDRKNYFYPDLPKGYQITQMELPIVSGGKVEIEIEGAKKIINLTRAHLEEDAGKSIHEGMAGTGVDLNRAGTPLLEIVSEPEISSAKEAVAYMKALHQIVTFLDVSDGNMSQGSLRCDANVSVRKKGDKKLGTRTEIKNINSFRFIEKAIDYEIERQIDVIESGESVTQETRLYDSIKNETRPMRSKEFANDYRYFPDPDLLPVMISDEEIEEIKATFPEMPKDKFIRYQSEFKIPENDAQIISSSKNLATFFEECMENVKDAKLLSNIMIGDISSLLNKENIEIADSKLSTKNVSELVNLVTEGVISGKIAKTVLEETWDSGLSPIEIVESSGLKQIDDDDEIERIIDQIISEHPDQVTGYKGGKNRLLGFFAGKTIRETRGKANLEAANKFLKIKLEN